MASNKNPFLDDLFPDPMRARKARIFKGYENVSNTAAFRFSALSSKVKAEGVVDKRAEVLLLLSENLASGSGLLLRNLSFGEQKF